MDFFRRLTSKLRRANSPDASPTHRLPRDHLITAVRSIEPKYPLTGYVTVELTRQSLPLQLSALKVIHSMLAAQAARQTPLPPTTPWFRMAEEGLINQLPPGSEDVNALEVLAEICDTIAREYGGHDTTLLSEMRRLAAAFRTLPGTRSMRAFAIRQGTTPPIPHFDVPYPRNTSSPPTQSLGPEAIETAAPAAEQTIERSLAALFVRLGPPPNPSRFEYAPTGHGDGGARK
ncbi:hypothetical protein ACIRU2_15885 [Streptomyces sp. NPDC101169]|uniref:hypothetical protein n=1 Tax=Streptomyces sp. NPDC101169 TaxID=3366121 RepID=UPI0037F6E3C0